MSFHLNPDTAMVQTIQEGLAKTGGYCPCRIERSADTRCICKEFRDQLSDPNYHGFCHCMLYQKD